MWVAGYRAVNRLNQQSLYLYISCYVRCGIILLPITLPSKTEPVLRTSPQKPLTELYLVMFSPVEPNLIAEEGYGNTRLFDIRSNQIG